MNLNLYEPVDVHNCHIKAYFWHMFIKTGGQLDINGSVVIGPNYDRYIHWNNRFWLEP